MKRWGATNIKCLIDCDILLYECAYAGEYKDEETGEKIPRDFETVKEVFEQRVKEIEDECWANEPSHFYITGDERLLKTVNKERKRDGQGPLSFNPNFRYEIASTVPYKDRKSQKPYHYYNLRSWVRATYPTTIAWGMEADDLLAIHQDCKGLTTVICSRDKDLRQVEGMQYSWECGPQPSWGPTRVDRIGELSLSEKGKLTGCGLKFFYSQLITGDRVDTIPGLPKGGPVLAFKLLSDCETEVEMYEKVCEIYKERIGEDWEDYLEEQSNLLWMVRELDEGGRPVLFRPPAR